MAHVIMVASGKGGTGKSTFATYLSTELALKKQKTLLIELDAGLRSIDVISGTDRKAVYDIGDILRGRCKAEKAMIISPHTDNLFIIAAPYKNYDTDFSGFRAVVDSVYNDFDFIIIDTAAGLGNAFQAACRASVTGIVVVTPDIISVRDGRLVSDEMFAAGVTDVRLIINKFSQQTFRFSGFEDIDDIIDRVCARLLGVIPMSAQIAVSAISGEELQPASIEKQIFSAVSQRIMGKDVQIVL
ncbi:MAG: AAA family ATPase [Oscillospiraceae bacterium]|nr:AAA family ATPase [Oscillospiraceae bacterium]